jgi:hypothetical protein
MTTTDKIAECWKRDRGRRYVEAFERHTKGMFALSIGLCSACSDCQSAFDVGELTLRKMIDEGLSDEGGISRAGCDCCGSGLQQNLYAGHCWITLDDGKEVLTHLELCSDCMLFIANGDFPENWEG